ncbi:MAG: ATP-binding cassette domain-containing protein [Blautia sp.]|nr:ATP-binding cassette domain-containing protein [Blautia sp.]
MENGINASKSGLLVLDVTIAYDHVVLEKFSAWFKEGGVYALMGPSGSGKTTLLRLLAGLETADSGRVCWTENGIEKLCPEAGYMYDIASKQVGFCFQEDRLLENRNAVENIRFAVPEYNQEEIIRLLGELGIDEQECHKPVADFSGGMKRRTAFLRALLYPSDLLLLDEPFKGLDEENRDRVIQLLLKRKDGRTVILTAHEDAEADACGAVIVRVSG